jgi:ATP-dependent Zn protease
MRTSGRYSRAYTELVSREEPPRLPARRVNDQAISLAREWRALGRAATAVAVITSPALFVLLHNTYGWSIFWSIVGAFFGVVIFRGLIDVLAHRFIPSPALYGAEDALKKQDVLSRRRVWYWRHKFKVWIWLGSIALVVLVAIALFNGESIGEAVTTFGNTFKGFKVSSIFGLAFQLLFLFLINFGILFGPMVAMGIQQIKSYEPGEADWGVKMADVRGQAEAKVEITRVVSLWQSGEEFEKAGGKRERGVLFLGAPGTGKTMLSKGIATSFNCPFVTIPGSGFAQTFIGMDAVIVRFLARKAKKLASKWGGQCIVFIDEIDAVGMRRSSLGTGFQPLNSGTIHDTHFFGPQGALTSSGDLVLETEAWREKLFAMRADPPKQHYPAFVTRAADAIRNVIMPGGMGMGGGMALNQLLVVMDGIDDPPLMKRVFTRRLNSFLDAMYLVPQKLGPLKLRLKPPRPRKEEVYFIGACNVPLQSLDPALTRPGRMGRHIYFRTPTWEDRRDIFDLYLGKVSHEPDLDTEKARDELARITNGYSPAMIDQACSLALTYAHSDGRLAFRRHDLVEAMTTVESGVAVGQQYPKHEARSIAIHEAGHAVCGHLYAENVLSTRLSIRRRGSSGGHHQAMAIEDRMVSWRSEEVGELIWVLGAMAAEHVFYGQTTTGVGGDIGSVTASAAGMVGYAAMAPAPIDLSDRIADKEEREKEEKRITERFERLGVQLMQRASTDGNPYAATLGDPGKRRLVAGLLGQAFVLAHMTIRANRAGVDYIASRLVAAGELYGDDVTDLLDEARLVKPEIDVLDEATWPVI